MAWRRSVLSKVGGFNVAIGHVDNPGRAIGGCEETLAAIRSTQLTGGTIVHARDAVVHHYVGPERVSFAYLLRRGWGEGMSKSVVRRVSGVPLRGRKGPLAPHGGRHRHLVGVPEAVADGSFPHGRARHDHGRVPLRTGHLRS